MSSPRSKLAKTIAIVLLLEIDGIIPS